MAHIVFDCDGTLISSFHNIVHGISVIVSEYLGKEVSHAEVRKHFTPDVELMYKRFGIDLTDELMEKFNKRWGEVTSCTDLKYGLFDGIEELLKDLKSQGHNLYVWTARDRFSTTNILKRLNVLHFFDDMRCCDDTPPKPRPHGLNEMVGAYDTNEVLMIGDSFTDIEGAKYFGCEVVAVFYCENARKEEVLRYDPDYTCLLYTSPSPRDV